MSRGKIAGDEMLFDQLWIDHNLGVTSFRAECGRCDV